MEVIKRADVREFRNSDACTAFEYPMGDADLNGAVVVISGRYPENGRAVNDACKEIGFVMEGAGRVEVEGRPVDLSKGDMVLILPGERYVWEGNMRLFVPCAPAWSADQHRMTA